MTGPAPWCAAFGAALADAAQRAGTLARAVARDWPDAEGQVRADRLTMLHRSLLRAADDAVGLTAAVVRSGDAAPGGAPLDLATLLARLAALGAGAGGSSGSRTGARLGGVDGDRAGDGTGMRLPGTEGSRPDG